jgi:hypothetical protein
MVTVIVAAFAVVDKVAARMRNAANFTNSPQVTGPIHWGWF